MAVYFMDYPSKAVQPLKIGLNGHYRLYRAHVFKIDALGEPTKF